MNVSTLATFIKLTPLTFLMSACQLPYLATGAYEQIKILNSRKPIKKVIKNVATPPEIKEKLEFTIQIKDFFEPRGLQCKGNFNTYVELNRPYVSYLLIASKKDEIKAKTWWFPIVGSFPYKGYFSEKKALKAAKSLNSNYDTFVRGVTAYSALGWFDEPILSSMLSLDKYDLADTVIHECFHNSFFIKNEVQLNEQYAVFFAHYFLLEFLNEKQKFEQIEIEKQKWSDQNLFSNFLKEIIDKAKIDYSQNTPKEKILNEIKKNYLENLKPKLEVLNYDTLFIKNLNNASLVAYQTYFHDFSELKKALSEKHSGDIGLFFSCLKKNEKDFKNCL